MCVQNILWNMFDITPLQFARGRPCRPPPPSARFVVLSVVVTNFQATEERMMDKVTANVPWKSRGLWPPKIGRPVKHIKRLLESKFRLGDFNIFERFWSHGYGKMGLHWWIHCGHAHLDVWQSGDWLDGCPLSIPPVVTFSRRNVRNEGHTKIGVGHDKMNTHRFCHVRCCWFSQHSLEVQGHSVFSWKMD